MKNKFQLAVSNWRLAKIFLSFVVCLLFIGFISCNNKPKGVIEENVYYVCSMDPQVLERQMGMCPICKMELAKVILTKEDMQSTSIKLNETQIKLANIKTDTVILQTIYERKNFTGIILVDENKIQQVSARVAGRVEHLFVKNTGEKVEAGQVLYDLYSEELISAQKEFLLSLKNKDLFGENFSVVSSARNKLLLWGMTEKQIEQLKLEGTVQASVPVISALSGVVTNIAIREGDYLEEGTTLMELADLSSLWVEGQLYPNDLQNLNEKSEVEVLIPSISDERIIGKVSFVNPELSPGNKINLIRIELDNSQMLYQPGMMAYIMINVNKKRVLAVPSKAVIQGENGSIVWVRNAEGKFDHRIVTTGIQNEDFIEIISGINEGQNIVTSGAYLLNSEFIFKKGADPMTHMHGNMK